MDRKGKEGSLKRMNDSVPCQNHTKIKMNASTYVPPPSDEPFLIDEVPYGLIGSVRGV